MKTLDISYFNDIQNAFQDSSAASCNWAEARIREIQDHLNNGGQIKIQESNHEIIIKSIDEIIDWKRTKNLPSVTFGIKIDNLGLIKKLNLNIQWFKVCKLEISESTNSFSFNKNLDLNLCSSTNECFYAGFKDTILHDFTKTSILNIEKLHFRLAYVSEIEKLKNSVDTNGKIILAVEIRTDNNKTINHIVCHELEN